MWNRQNVAQRHVNITMNERKWKKGHHAWFMKECNEILANFETFYDSHVWVMPQSATIFESADRKLQFRKTNTAQGHDKLEILTF